MRDAVARGDILVIVDTLAFSTAVATAVAGGAHIYPCADSDDAAALARKTGAEIAVRRDETPEKGRFSLSPLTYIDVEPGTEIVLPSPNGATCSRCGRDAPYLFVGALVNAGAIARTVTQLLNDLDIGSTAERWAIVKALDQFGHFSSLAPITTASVCDPSVAERCVLVPGPATFNLIHAVYRSRYLVFDHRDLLDVHGRPLQVLTPAERTMFRRYAYRKTRHPREYPNPYWTVVGPHWPVLVVGSYVETQAGVGRTTTETSQGKPFSFAEIRHALNVGDIDHHGPIVSGVNAEANIIVALICHADGRKPATACARPVIKKLIKHVA